MFGDHLPVPIVRPHFDIGDIVWAQARGLPSWPGKIVDENKVGKGKADDGKVHATSYLFPSGINAPCHPTQLF